MPMKQYIVALLGAYLVGGALGVILMLGSQATVILFAFTLLLATIPTVVVAVPIVLVLHLTKRRSLKSFLSGGLVCGLLMSIWNALKIGVEDSDTSILPMYGFVSRSSLVLIVSCVAGALTYWYLAFRKTKGPSSQQA